MLKNQKHYHSQMESNFEEQVLILSTPHLIPIHIAWIQGLKLCQKVFLIDFLFYTLTPS